MPMDYQDFFSLSSSHSGSPDPAAFPDVRLMCHPANLLVEFIPPPGGDSQKKKKKSLLLTEIVVQARPSRQQGEEADSAEHEEEDTVAGGIAVRYLPDASFARSYFRTDFKTFTEATFWATGGHQTHGLSYRSREHTETCPFQIYIPSVVQKDYRVTSCQSARPFSPELETRLLSYYSPRNKHPDTSKELVCRNAFFTHVDVCF